MRFQVGDVARFKDWSSTFIICGIDYSRPGWERIIILGDWNGDSPDNPMFRGNWVSGAVLQYFTKVI